MRLKLPSERRDPYTAIALVTVVFFLLLTRSLWSLLFSGVLLIGLYLILCNEERFRELAATGESDNVGNSVLGNSVSNGGMVRRIGDVYIGRSVDTNSVICINLGDTTHTAIYAQSGGGKTTILYALLYDIISLYDPGRIRVAICDPKVYSFNIFGRIPHLYAPVGRGVKESLLLLRRVVDELAEREKLFARLPQDRLCESIADYHRIVYELDLGLPELPLLIVVVDEVQEVAARDEATVLLTRLAKKGRALGIRLVVATQRPTTIGLSHEIQSQLETKLVGFMDSSQEYSFARVPPEVYGSMTREPGRFMLRAGGSWVHVKVERVAVDRLEKMLRVVGGGRTELTWSETDARYGVDGTIPLVGVGKNETDKGREIVRWLVDRGEVERPSAEEFMAVFDVSESTAYRKLERYWPVALARIIEGGGEV